MHSNYVNDELRVCLYKIQLNGKNSATAIYINERIIFQM